MIDIHNVPMISPASTPLSTGNSWFLMVDTQMPVDCSTFVTMATGHQIMSGIKRIVFLRRLSTQDVFLQYRDFVPQAIVCFDHELYFAACVHDRSVVLASEFSADLGE